MILFFRTPAGSVIAVGTTRATSDEEKSRLSWLFGEASLINADSLSGTFVGPRREMITPWSTNAVEITQNMGLTGISRIEEFFPSANSDPSYDKMLQQLYPELDQAVFTVSKTPEKVVEINDIAAYNREEGLALNSNEISYLEGLAKRVGRALTDSEVFGFSQVNSEHCRHKIFNGTFIIDGVEKESSLFRLIKNTTAANRNVVSSAYKDNCAFLDGPEIEFFAPLTQDKADYFAITREKSVLSLKAETHNFPTTVEPFNGASTGTGGEIRDRIAGGKGAFPVAGTAVYMTSYPRSDGSKLWENNIEKREWLYQTPEDILIKASNGASDFGNKFGQPLINGSLLTFEHNETGKMWGFDKVIMLAGGIGIGKKRDSEKDIPEKGDLIILLGGDNYRIGMGGGAVSSVETGAYSSSIELNAVQRANPEMQKRVYNAIRALAESGKNPIVSIHDHGAGGHLNCLSELVEATGGKVDISKLPVGDPTLSAREIIGNESQERMGLIMKKEDAPLLKKIADRERAPFYIVGEVTGDHQFTFYNSETGEKPLDLILTDFFGDTPETVLNDKTAGTTFDEIRYDISRFEDTIEKVLQLEQVACKDWLTNKVDRSVTGRVAMQQCAGEHQLPLNNLGAIALDYRGERGMATSLGHAPVAALIDPSAGSRLAIAESLTNIVWAPLTHGLKGVSLSANWMWPCRNNGEDARLYSAVEAAGQFSTALGINIPTGKDSLSMTQKYDDKVVYSPGTVIITATAEISDIKKIITPVLSNDPGHRLIYLDMSCSEPELGGSALGQIMNKVGTKSPDVVDPEYFAIAFEALQEMILNNMIVAGHDISSGGLLTTLLEMCFSNREGGLNINLSSIDEPDIFRVCFHENPGVIIQVTDEQLAEEFLLEKGISYHLIGTPSPERKLCLINNRDSWCLDIDHLRDKWFRTSYLFDRKQCGEDLASERYDSFPETPLEINTGEFKGTFKSLGITPDRKTRSGINAAIIREKGVNGDREMAYALWLAGFDVKDVHMTDLINGSETLEDVNMIVFVGGFSNSDVLGSAKGWAGAFRYNEKARITLDKFYAREDTLSLGVCNGCQLMVELNLIYPGMKERPMLVHNSSGKFESSFLGVKIESNDTVMLGNMAGLELGIWVAHGEGRFILKGDEQSYKIPVKYSYPSYPANPNGSDHNAAAVASADGRHLAIMPHLERSFFPWQCGYYPQERKTDEVTPWIRAFVNAHKWISAKVNKK